MKRNRKSNKSLPSYLQRVRHGEAHQAGAEAVPGDHCEQGCKQDDAVAHTLQPHSQPPAWDTQAERWTGAHIPTVSFSETWFPVLGGGGGGGTWLTDTIPLKYSHVCIFIKRCPEQLINTKKSSTVRGTTDLKYLLLARKDSSEKKNTIFNVTIFNTIFKCSQTQIILISETLKCTILPLKI